MLETKEVYLQGTGNSWLSWLLKRCHLTSLGACHMSCSLQATMPALPCHWLVSLPKCMPVPGVVSK